MLAIEKLRFGFPDARQYQSSQEIERFKAIYFPESQQIDKLKSEPVYPLIQKLVRRTMSLSCRFSVIRSTVRET